MVTEYHHDSMFYHSHVDPWKYQIRDKWPTLFSLGKLLHQCHETECLHSDFRAPLASYKIIDCWQQAYNILNDNKIISKWNNPKWILLSTWKKSLSLPSKPAQQSYRTVLVPISYLDSKLILHWAHFGVKQSVYTIQIHGTLPNECSFWQGRNDFRTSRVP